MDPGQKVPVLVRCFAGCEQGAVIQTLRERGLLQARTPRRKKFIEAYSYGPKLRKVRMHNVETGKKEMFWEVKVNGEWRPHKGGRPDASLYRADELPKSPSVVFVVEGERKVNLLRSWGLYATCSPHGASDWKPVYAARLAQHYLVVLPDNDDDGRGYEHKVVAGRDRRRGLTISLPGLGEAEDICDWAQNGGTKEELLTLTALDRCEVCGNSIAPGQRGPRRTACSHACKCRRERQKNRLAEASISEKTVSLPVQNPENRLAQVQGQDFQNRLAQVQEGLLNKKRERERGAMGCGEGDSIRANPAGVPFAASLLDAGTDVQASVLISAKACQRYADHQFRRNPNGTNTCKLCGEFAW